MIGPSDPVPTSALHAGVTAYAATVDGNHSPGFPARVHVAYDTTGEVALEAAETTGDLLRARGVLAPDENLTTRRECADFDRLSDLVDAYRADLRAAIVGDAAARVLYMVSAPGVGARDAGPALARVLTDTVGAGDPAALADAPLAFAVEVAERVGALCEARGIELVRPWPELDRDGVAYPRTEHGAPVLTVGALRALLDAHDVHPATHVVIDDGDAWYLNVSGVAVPTEGAYCALTLLAGDAFDTRQV